MFQVRGPILYFFLLVLGVFLNFTSDVVYIRSRFSMTIPEKSLNFVLGESGSPVTFGSSLMLLPAEVDFLIKKKPQKIYVCDLLHKLF